MCFFGTGDFTGWAGKLKDQKKGGNIMKKILSVAFVLLLAAIVATGVGAGAASAAGGPLVQPYWYTGIDSSGQFINPTVQPDTQNSAQYVIYDIDNNNFIITAHPNYYPSDDDQFTAQQTTVITSIEVYNGTTYESCIVGGTFVVSADYIQYTSANHPYLQFNVTLTKYDNKTGAVVAPSPYVYPTAYLNLSSVY